MYSTTIIRLSLRIRDALRNRPEHDSVRDRITYRDVEHLAEIVFDAGENAVSEIGKALDDEKVYTGEDVARLKRRLKEAEEYAVQYGYNRRT